MGRRKQPWSIGDLFTVELLDGQRVVGQIVGREAEALNSVTVAFFSGRVPKGEEVRVVSPEPASVFSVVFSTRESLDSGRWRVVGSRPVAVPKSAMPNEAFRASGWVGAKIFGSGILNKFLNAYHGLRPWDDWKDPLYLDSLLIAPEKKPQNLVYKVIR